MDIKLKDIYFGRADGLQESEEKSFENLFYKGNQKYDLLYENESKFIISGRKGTGKTILAKYFELEMNKKGIPTVTLNKREYMLNSYLEKGEFTLNSEERSLFIEYTILREMAKIVLMNRKKLYSLKQILNIFKIKSAIDYLDEVVKMRFSASNFSKVEYQASMNSSAEINTSLGTKDIGATIGGSCTEGYNISEAYKKNPYYNIIDGIRKNLFFLLKIMPVNIIFDDLDELEVKIDGNVGVILTLNSFITVANQLNVEIRREKLITVRL